MLSMDKQLYLFDWSLMGKNTLTEPKVTINCSGITKVEIKKDFCFVITEKKGGLIGRTLKHTFKAHTLQDLE